jgi:hypothetical protein
MRIMLGLGLWVLLGPIAGRQASGLSRKLLGLGADQDLRALSGNQLLGTSTRFNILVIP